MKQFWNSYFPLPPYYNFRFSNGPVWIENFPTRDLLDFAYGGALVNQSGYQLGPPSLMAQINDFLISRHFDSMLMPMTHSTFLGRRERYSIFAPVK